MLIVEHDAKEILSRFGIPVPAGTIVEVDTRLAEDSLPPGPWMAKAQATIGGRGKAGGVIACDDTAALQRATASIGRMQLGGRPVRWVRIESRAAFECELYVSVNLDTRTGRVAVLVSDAGGVDVEANAQTINRKDAHPEASDIVVAISAAAGGMSPEAENTLREAAPALSQAFIEADASLIEINPLFVMADGGWLAGDAKMIIDENALFRRPWLEKLLRDAGRYDDLVERLDSGFDFMVLDEAGTVGLLTTGAGLTMSVIDEMAARGIVPFNFCDIRTGQIHDDPSRLVRVLSAMNDAPSIETILVNVFAGITDLANFAARLVEAAAAVGIAPDRIVARLVGHRCDEAIRILHAWSSEVRIARDLDHALDLIADHG